ncbi:MAG: hypothetical protein U9Q83_09490 [Bacteroidota bacterium]|nr:hypothetical protein [Bacteroidota bacterium]
MQTKNKTHNNSENYSIIGIKTNEQDYKVAWKLNSIIDTNFSKIELYLDNFSMFLSVLKKKEILLIENKNTGNILFKDMKEFDFILKVFAKGEIIELIIKKLKESSDFYYFSIIIKEKLTKKTIKSLTNLIV